MATVIFNDPSIFYSSLDVSAAHTAVAIGAGAEALDDTAFGDDTRSNKGGLKTVDISAEGYYNANTSLDAVYFNAIGGSQVLTVVPETIAVGGVSYFIDSFGSSYNPIAGSVGELLKFNIQALNQKSNLIRGIVDYNATAGSSSASTGSQLGAVATGKKIYAAVHCTAASGSSPTLDIDVQSDDNGSFTSAVTRTSFTQLVATGSEMISQIGPFTDDYWRINFTIGGGSPSFTFTVSLGIGD